MSDGVSDGVSDAARARYAALFASESRELLTAASVALAALGRDVVDGAAPGAAVDALFRSVHSLKGMAGAMAYAGPESLAHAVETVLARVRDGALTLAPEHVDALVAAVDALDGAVDAAIAGRGHDVAADVESLLLLTAPAARPRARAAARALVATEGTLVAQVRIAPECPLPGARALLVVRRLEALGALDAMQPSRDALLDAAFDGVLAVRVRTTEAPDVVERAVRAAGDVAEVRVAQPVRAAPRAGAPAREMRDGPRDAHVRVERARLDALLDVAGELTLARARLSAAAASVGDPALAAVVADVARLVGALHAEVRSTRTAPVADVFERLPRVVREVARAVGKRAELVLEGGDTLLDRAVLEELTDPLVHLLRNAVDHGLESPADRAAAGKAPTGRVVLRAEREGDAVLVSVRDDGRGIDRSRVVERARDAGVVVAAGPDALDDAALLALVARPGLSTAARVSSVSGRGVGIDAVRDRVRRLGGTLALASEAGQGTCFTVRLPLTLALGRALVARAGTDRYALPVAHLRETVEAPAASLGRDMDGETLRVRDETLPVVRLGAAVGVARQPHAASDDETEVAGPDVHEAVVVEAAGRRVALLVDAIDGQQDVLVKPLPPLRGAYRIFGGATILADGTPALVLDAPALVGPAAAGHHRSHR